MQFFLLRGFVPPISIPKNVGCCTVYFQRKDRKGVVDPKNWTAQ